jgi:hypothetical protein
LLTTNFLASKPAILPLKVELGYLEDQLLSIANSLSNTIKNAIEDIRDESEGVAKIFEKKLDKDIKSIAKSSEIFLSNTQKIANGTAKVSTIQKQIRDSEIQRLNVLRSLTVLQNQGVLTADQANDKAKELMLAYMVQNELFREQLASVVELEEKLGLTGKIIKGISKIPLIGNLVDTNKALEEAAKSSSKIGAMGSALKSIGKDVFKNITDPLAIASFSVKAIYDFLVNIDKSSGELAKNMNITYSSAVDLKGEFKKIGDNVGDAFVNSRSMSESLMAVNSSLGTSVKLSTDELITFTKLREEAGYTNEELVSIQKLTLATGGNLKDNVKSFAGTVQLMNAQNKLSINEKQLLKEVANTSAAIKLSVGGTTEALAKSAFQAKQFGINLDQADKISQSLLDFESSISNELSAELITGKDLNLEKARLLAINGDIAGAGAEILKQVGGTAEFTKMNRIQQEALAAAVGLGRDELAKSLIDREALAKLGGQDVEIDGKKVTLQEYYNKLKSDGLTQDQISAKLGDESLAKQLEQTSNAEKMQASIEKLKEAFIPIAEAILPKINSALQWFSENINGIVLSIKALGIFMGTKMLVSMTLNAFQASAIAAATTTTAIAQQLNAQATIKAAVAQGTLSAEAGITAIAQSEAAIASLTTAGAASGGLAIPLILGAVAAAVGAFMMYKSSASQKKFAKGGIVTGEINNATVGEAGPEAIIPLNSPAGKRILGEGGSGGTNIKVENQITAGESTFVIDGMVIAKAITPYIIEEMRKTAVKIQ